MNGFVDSVQIYIENLNTLSEELNSNIYIIKSQKEHFQSSLACYSDLKEYLISLNGQ